MTERRTARRYSLSLPAVVTAPMGGTTPRKGTTRDVSMKGVYLLLDRVVSEGSDVELTMFLPADVIDGPRVVVCASASVVRVDRWIEEGSARIGVGAIIQRYELVQKKGFAGLFPES